MTHSVVKYLTVYMIQPESQDENALKGITLHTQMFVNIGIRLLNMVTLSKNGKPYVGMAHLTHHQIKY